MSSPGDRLWKKVLEEPDTPYTVAELIHDLQELDPELTVVFRDDALQTYGVTDLEVEGNQVVLK